VVFLDSVYKGVKTGEVKAAMGTLTANLDNDDLSDVATGIFEQRDINVEILSEGGAILYTSGQNDFLPQREFMREISRLYRMTLENGGEYFERPFQSDSPPKGGPFRPQALYHCKLIERPSDDVFIILTALISPVDATVGTLRIELYFVTGFMLLFSMLLALLIARRIAKPIVSISESAKTLAAGRYDVLFDARGYREIRELSDTLNVAAKELSAVDGLRRELVSNISHDLRTPLTLIAGYAEAMRDLPGENTPENAQIIVDEAKRLNRFVGDVLDLSKLQSGGRKLKPTRYNLTKSLREIVLRLSELTKAGGYTILFEADADAHVLADESHISQAVYNLLANAVSFTGEDKTVTLRQVTEPDAVTVEVADTGKGVAPEELAHIWERYYRSEKKHRRAEIGSGIGLSIVKSIMELHGGVYGVKSEPGKGSVFWIGLKRQECES
jgi:signal transduction histidine kinase